MKKHFRTGTDEERFWAKVNKDGPLPEYAPELGPCWLWTDIPDTAGYGRFWWEGKHHYAHHFVCAVGIGQERDHLCRVRHCVRPSHIEAVAKIVNIRRGDAGKATGARNAAKTHCPSGHPYDEANTYIRPSRGDRFCRICQREAQRRYAARKTGLT